HSPVPPFSSLVKRHYFSEGRPLISAPRTVVFCNREKRVDGDGCGRAKVVTRSDRRRGCARMSGSCGSGDSNLLPGMYRRSKAVVELATSEMAPSFAATAPRNYGWRFLQTLRVGGRWPDNITSSSALTIGCSPGLRIEIGDGLNRSKLCYACRVWAEDRALRRRNPSAAPDPTSKDGRLGRR